ncbi:hypothetical protein M2105_004870, partial [Paenibacillus sp. PastF-1]|nr:hypothetical protein [Paenibacillus sp. PastF-2]MDF9850501.1 hypothetical protein [Paenibacillus sp. PastM-2]MDF9856994.1 hypothetical protein [Paenibacillus sp. PastF-1]MDH6482266.1 hypothetical protein [Paenibacillus sp. PastH-2]
GALLTFWNRRMRTRMYGGVRGRGLAAPSYSISIRMLLTDRTAFIWFVESIFTI